jgi:1-acyl-sn-glycerol-3-phosphate acyltransferase
MSEKRKPLDYASKPSYPWYRFLLVIFTVLFRVFWPMKIKGKENVPKTGSSVVVSNHLSLIDPFVVSYASGRIVRFMAKEELFGTPIIGFLIRRIGAFPVNRTRQDAASMRTALTVLKEGELLGMFPEGTRSTTGDLQEFRTGAIRIAARTRNPIIPTALIDTDRALPPGKWIRPARIAVVFGEPIEFPELYDRNDKGEAMENAVAVLRARVQALHDDTVREMKGSRGAK